MERNISIPATNASMTTDSKLPSFFTFRILFYPVLIVLGTTLNGMVIAVLRAGHLKLSYVYRYLLINLALADIGVLLVAATISVLVGPAVDWKIGETVCRLLVPVGDTLIPVSSGTLFLLAVARYKAIKNPFAPQWTRRLLFRLIFCNWLASLLFAVTPLQVWITMKSVQGSALDKCYLSAPFSHVVAWYVTVIAVLIVPTLTSLWLIVLISQRSLKRANVMCRSQATNRTSLTRKRENKHATQLILATSAVYTVLVMPYFSLTLALRWGLQNTETVNLILELTQVLFYSQCAIDPILYCLVNKNIRSRMIQTNQRIFAFFCKLFPRSRLGSRYRVAYSKKSQGSSYDDTMETTYVREPKVSLLSVPMVENNKRKESVTLAPPDCNESVETCL